MDEIQDFDGVPQTQGGVMTQSFNKNGIERTRGAAQQQANWDRAKLDAVMDWMNEPKAKLVSQLAQWRFYEFENIAPGTAYVERSQSAVVVNPKTWRTLSIKIDVQGLFMRNMVEGASGMKFLTMDSGPYGEAARAEAERDGVPVTKDPLTGAEEQARSLIVQASGLASGATQMQMQIFSTRYADLQSQVAVLEERMARLRSLVDIAGEAVMGACA